MKNYVSQNTVIRSKGEVYSVLEGDGIYIYIGGWVVGLQVGAALVFGSIIIALQSKA